jgi:hypothetical protein
MIRLKHLHLRATGQKLLNSRSEGTITTSRKTCEFFCYFGMAQYDVAIALWKVKYDINRGSGVRPITYIHEVMNKPDWEPYIETPPFPEYPSGHSGFSGAATQVLTKYFGDNVEFTDSTNEVIALNPRTFKSFYAAADEAGYSRMYGVSILKPRSSMESKWDAVLPIT